MSLETQSPDVVRFGIFDVDVRAGELRKRGVRIKLQELPFRVLILLLQRPGKVVTREELRSSIWSADTFVDFDNSLNASINKLREALGDSADNPRFIETLPRRGYRFVAPIGCDGRRKTFIRASGRKVLGEWIVVALAVVVGAALIAGGMYWRSRLGRRLTDQDTIVLADFANTTGDVVFDDTLKQGLRVQLEQSPFLDILSDQRVNEELRMMGRTADQRLTGDLGLDLCQRVGSKAVLTGSISAVGTHYVVGLNALNCRTGDDLASDQGEADSREHVFKALNELATKMRVKLGESLATVQKYDVPVEQATTPSLEALQAYSLGLKAWWTRGSGASLPFFKRAVELDPTLLWPMVGWGPHTPTTASRHYRSKTHARLTSCERGLVSASGYTSNLTITTTGWDSWTRRQRSTSCGSKFIHEMPCPPTTWFRFTPTSGGTKGR